MKWNSVVWQTFISLVKIDNDSCGKLASWKIQIFHDSIFIAFHFAAPKNFPCTFINKRMINARASPRMTCAVCSCRIAYTCTMWVENWKMENKLFLLVWSAYIAVCVCQRPPKNILFMFIEWGSCEIFRIHFSSWTHTEYKMKCERTQIKVECCLEEKKRNTEAKEKWMTSLQLDMAPHTLPALPGFFFSATFSADYMRECERHSYKRKQSSEKSSSGWKFYETA